MEGLEFLTHYPLYHIQLHWQGSTLHPYIRPTAAFAVWRQQLLEEKQRYNCLQKVVDACRVLYISGEKRLIGTSNKHALAIP